MTIPVKRWKRSKQENPLPCKIDGFWKLNNTNEDTTYFPKSDIDREYEFILLSERWETTPPN